MLARPHERPPRPTYFKRAGQTRPTRLDPGLLDVWTGQFVAQLAAPSAELMTTSDGVILVDVATGAQAWTEQRVGCGGITPAVRLRDDRGRRRHATCLDRNPRRPLMAAADIAACPLGARGVEHAGKRG